MKIQELAIIFIIIILPISLLLSEYTQFQIKTLNTQTLYDAKLTAATYDAIKAFQLNTSNEGFSDLANEKMRDLTASVNTFRKSILSAFKLTGYTDDELNNYIPALVYTLYDGFYIYSPYNNTNHRYEEKVDADGNTIKDPYTEEPEYETVSGAKIPTDGNGENTYGLKPYISYSCRYRRGNIDVVITYALDNYVVVQGTIEGKYVNRGGYLIDNITYTPGADTDGDGVEDDYNVTYNGITIEEECLEENITGGTSNVYKYCKVNGVKYYLMGNKIVTISNGKFETQYSEDKVEDQAKFYEYKQLIENNTFAKQYYKEAYEFSYWFKNETDLDELQYQDAYQVITNEDGTTEITKLWDSDTRKIFDFNTTSNAKDNIENELSNFNQHRLAVIRNKIETNLAIAISNYNTYSGAATTNVFQMPELKEDEWDYIIHNISLISFLQGLSIGGKTYNGYTIVTNSESEEVVLEDNIYILGEDGSYHRIGDKDLEDGSVSVDAGIYGDKKSAGRLNLDFNRITLTNTAQTYYYYPLEAYNASYNSVVMQNKVTTYDDIYKYINNQRDDLKIAFYTALGRERASKFNSNIVSN